MSTEVAARADFSIIRYAQVWEDADVLLAALDIQPGETYVSIASAGDNALAMLTKNPGRVVALDLNPSQLACLELRVAAYKKLTHSQLLELLGSTSSSFRLELYETCRPLLTSAVRKFWDANLAVIEGGIGAAGKFERYFSVFKDRILPLIHRARTIDALLENKDMEERRAFYEKTWNTWRWRLLFQIFFSKTVMGKMGRDPSFFQYVQGDGAKKILEHTRFALCELNPYENPYLQWILKGRHTTALPCALRPENFEIIRNNLDRLEWHCQSIEAFLESTRPEPVSGFNLSDIFEYMSETNTEKILRRLVGASKKGARLAYWNMLVPRNRPETMAHQLKSLKSLAEELYARDKAFFYYRFVVANCLISFDTEGVETLGAKKGR